ncbi:glutaredoxin [Pluteus cervinus]|uniref:Glutaredoxin n=1 Tax=Pluteus cervinus TaxID=181527 RepID=A0ACD3ATF8_9AGAR|nr:glutaredoxin [Pluteus cervinus]
MSVSAKELVEAAIAENQVAIFSKSYCPFCKKTKTLFAEKFPDLEPKIFELDIIPEGADIQAYLLEKTKQRTVPNVFVEKEHIGGNDDTQAAFRDGKLTKLLALTA